MSENLLKPFEKISNSLRSDSEIFSNNADFQALRVATLPANAQKTIIFSEAGVQNGNSSPPFRKEKHKFFMVEKS